MPVVLTHLLALPVKLSSLLLDHVLQGLLSLLDDERLLDLLGLRLDGHRWGLPLPGSAALVLSPPHHTIMNRPTHRQKKNEQKKKFYPSRGIEIMAWLASG